VAGALAGVAGAALAVTALQPSSHQPGHRATAQLTAWTVASQANGDIRITIRELRDPAGLQRTLRADGRPVNVSFSGPPLSTSCQPHPASKSQLRSVAQFHPGGKSAVLVIHPSALPQGAGVFIFDRSRAPAGTPSQGPVSTCGRPCTGEPAVHR